MKLKEIIKHNTVLLLRSEQRSPNAADLYYHDLAESTLKELEKLQKLERIDGLFTGTYKHFVTTIKSLNISCETLTQEEYEKTKKLIKLIKEFEVD